VSLPSRCHRGTVQIRTVGATDAKDRGHSYRRGSPIRTLALVALGTTVAGEGAGARRPGQPVQRHPRCVHYGEEWVGDDTFGVTDWTLTGTTSSGVPVNVRGCDHYTFRAGRVVRKDSYWKIVEEQPGRVPSPTDPAS
jgi:hypothetical protein